jgi:predicted site-specific integrase-resolvase
MSSPTAPLIGSTEAARRIGVDKSTLSRWSQEERIKVALKLPGKNGIALYAEAEVDRMAAEYAASLVPATPSPEGEA